MSYETILVDGDGRVVFGADFFTAWRKLAGAHPGGRRHTFRKR